MDADVERVEVDAALERQGLTWLPAKGDRIVLRPTDSLLVWHGAASGDVAVIGGRVMVGLELPHRRRGVGLERVWGDHPPTVTMHDLECVFPEKP